MSGSRIRRGVPGHKRAKVLHGVQVQCECGWSSATWYGKGAMKNAHGEYHWHLGEHARIVVASSEIHGA